VKIVAALLVAAGLGVGLGGFVLYQHVSAPYRGYTDQEQYVEIPAGAGTSAIGRRLVSAGVVSDTVTYRVALWLSGRARHLQAGDYRFEGAMTAGEVIEKIARGDVDRISVTFPEGLTIVEMAAIFEAHGLGPAAAFVEAARSVRPAPEFDPAARDLEGYLFPDTYAVSRRTNAAHLVTAMLERFEHVLTPEVRQAASARGFTIRQLVTLASLVEKETARADERPLVAAVYANRLQKNMGLQCDPTVIYALQRAGRFDGNLRRDDLLFDSPYNTYRYAGLPPGPIAAPGKAALEAAANPAETEFLYFVSRNDGSHEFARTLEEHNRNVQRFQVEYFKERRRQAAQH
jgi:peptidoglycan lytic transglycosylase G